MKTLDTIAQAIFDKKGFNILVLDVRAFSTMTNFYIIAEGNVNRHVKAIANFIVDTMREAGLKPLHIEGTAESEWVVIDYGDIVIHLFIPEIREKYALEELWKESKIVDVKIVVKESIENESYA